MKKPDLTNTLICGYWFLKLLGAVVLAGLYFYAGPANAAVFQGETLANGTRVYIAHTPGHQRTVFRLGSTVGPDDVPCDKLQLPHLTEHLMFDGFGPDGRERVTQVMTRYAGSINAYTAPTAVTIVGYAHSRFSEDVIRVLGEAIAWRPAVLSILERERKVVKAELNYDEIDALLGRVTGASYDLLSRRLPGECGRDTSIADITAGDVEGFWADLFEPRNLTLYVASDVPPAVLLPAIRAAFGARQSTGDVIPLHARAPVTAGQPLSVLTWAAGTRITLGALIPVDTGNTNPMAQALFLALLREAGMDAVRHKGGHTYSVDVESRPEYGAILVTLSPRPGESVQAMAALRGAIEQVRKGQLPEQRFNEKRTGTALLISAWGSSPEINVDNAVWRHASLEAGVDFADVSALEHITQPELADFADAWITDEPIYFEDRRPMSYVPLWLMAIVFGVLIAFAVPWKKLQGAISSLRNKP